MKSLLFTMAALVAIVTGAHYMQPRGLRNNNPFNIRESHNDGTHWQGEHEFDLDQEFEEFADSKDGIRAGGRIFKTYREKYGIATIRTILQRFAPPSENNTESYIKSVVAKSGIDADSELLDIYDYTKVAQAMIYHENGQNPFNFDYIKEHLQRGFV